ncbi:MAG: hypothetical protein WC748_02070 [Legionellales bacterium]
MPRDTTYYTTLLAQALAQATLAEQRTLLNFKTHLQSVIASSLDGLSIIASGRVAPDLPIYINMFATALNVAFDSIAGTIAGRAVITVSSQYFQGEAKRLNPLLVEKDTIVENFCAQAIIYHRAQILDINTPEMGIVDTALTPLKKAMHQVIKTCLPSSKLTYAHETLINDLSARLMDNLIKAAVLFEEKHLSVDHIGDYLAQQLVVVKDSPLTPALALTGAFDTLSLEARYQISLDAIRLALLTYEDKSFIHSMAKQWHYNLNNPTSFFYQFKSDSRSILLANQDTVICLFRGAPDISSNLLAALNGGFNKALNDLWNEDEGLGNRLDYHAKFPPKRFLFIGHSSGAALALLASARFYQKYPQHHDKLTVLTFGQPRLEKGLPAGLDKHVHRFVHTDDPIPSLPPEIGYEHIGAAYLLPDVTEIFNWKSDPSVPKQMGTQKTAHSLTAYQYRLMEHARSYSDALNIQFDDPMQESTYTQAYDLGNIVFRTNFLTQSLQSQQENLELFSSVLIQGLYQSGGVGFIHEIKNGLAKLSAISDHYNNKITSATSDAQRFLYCKILVESQRLHFWLRIAKLQHIDVNQLRDVFDYLNIEDKDNDDIVLNQHLIKVENVLEENDSIKTDKDLASLVFIQAFMQMPNFPRGKAESLRRVLATRSLSNELVQISVLELLTRIVKDKKDYWPVLLGDMGAVDLNIWFNKIYPDSLIISLYVQQVIIELQRVKPNDDILNALNIKYAQLKNNPLTKDLLMQVLYEVSVNTTISPLVRLQALQGKQKIQTLPHIQQADQEGVVDVIPSAHCILTYLDYQALGELALLANEFTLATFAMTQAHQLLTIALAGADASNKSELEAKLTMVNSKVIALHWQEIQTKNNPWDKSLSYQNILRFDDGNSAASQALFDQGLGIGLQGFEEKLKGIASPIIPAPSVQSIHTRCANGEVLLQTTFNGWWALNEDAVKALDNRKFIQKSTHKIAIVGDLHIKENPGCIGLAFAAWALSRWMFFDMAEAADDIGIIPVQPAKIMRYRNGTPVMEYVQLSPTVTGDNVQTLLSTNSDPEQLKNLENFYFSAMLIVNLLLNMEDGRDANSVVRNRQLLSVDNDHAFVRDELSDGIFNTQNVEVKNIVFCMQAMQQPIDPKVRQFISAITFAPLSRIRAWLYTVRHYNQTVDKLFGKDIKALYERPDDNAKVVLQAFFDAKGLAQPCMKMIRIQDALKTLEIVTHQDLFRKIQPKLAKIYEDSFTQTTTLLQRMQKIGGLSGVSQSTHSQVIAKVTGKKTKDYFEFLKNQQGPKDLLLVLREVQSDKMFVDIIIKEITQGEFTTFAREQDLQELVLTKLNATQYEHKNYTSVAHQAFLQAISTELTSLVIKGNPLLTDDELMVLIKKMPNLRSITFIACPRLTGFAYRLGLVGNVRYDWLNELCEHGVNDIKLNNCVNLDPVLLQILPQIFQKYPKVEFDINPPKTWNSALMGQVAAVYPDKGLLIPEFICDFPTGEPPDDDDGEVMNVQEPIYALAVLPNSWLVSGAQRKLQIWEVVSIQQLKLLHERPLSKPVYVLTVLMNGWLVGSTFSEIKIWNIRSSGSLQLLHSLDEYVFDLAVLQNAWLACRISAGISFWEISSESQPKHLYTVEHEGGRYGRLTVLRNGWLVSSSSYSDQIKIWEARSKGEPKLLHILEKDSESNSSLLNSWLFNTLNHGTVRIWGMKSKNHPELLHQWSSFRSRILSLTYLPNGFAVGGLNYGAIFLWGVIDSTPKYLNSYYFKNNFSIMSITILKNGWLVIGSGNGTIRLLPFGEYVVNPQLANKSKITRFSYNIKMLLTHNQLSIEQVSLIFNKNITKDLTSLNLSNTAIDDPLLEVILDCCPRLINIKYDSCSELTAVGKNMIANRQKRLHGIIQYSAIPDTNPTNNITQRNNTPPATTNTYTTKGWMPSYTTIAIAATTLGVGAIIAYGYKKFKKL